jgi:predicted alpha/beta superfamily hydrolase
VVFPLAETRASLDGARRTLFGHSLAGYFTLWVLANRCRAFRNYAAISPSIWWDREGLFAAAPKAAGHDRRLFMAVGEWEEALPPWQIGLPGSEAALARRQARRMIANVRELGSALQAVMGEERVRFTVLAEEDHASIVSAAIPRALRLASLP